MDFIWGVCVVGDKDPVRSHKCFLTSSTSAHVGAEDTVHKTPCTKTQNNLTLIKIFAYIWYHYKIDTVTVNQLYTTYRACHQD